MRRIGAGLLLFSTLTTMVWAKESGETPVYIPTGIEWLQSVGIQREQALLAALMTVRSAGVEMRGSFLEYDDGLRRHLMRHPDLQAKSLTDSLADYVYETNPTSRPILDRLRARHI